MTQAPGKLPSRRFQDPAAAWPVCAVAAIITVSTLAAYANTFRVPFLFDDQRAIVDNTSIRHLDWLGGLLKPPVSSPTDGRPVLNVSLAFNYAWSGLATWSYHLVNLGVHILAGLALFGIARRTLLGPALRNRLGNAALPLSALISIIWTIHPLQTESVTYLSQRAESLMGLFYLLTLYFFIRSTDSRKPKNWRVLSTLACFCGMATKEGMVTAPVLILFYDWAFISDSVRQALRHRLGYYLGLSSAWLLLAFLMMHAHLSEHGIGLHSGVSCVTYFLTELKVVTMYVRLALWPHPLVFDYGSEMLVTHVLDVLPFGLLVIAGVIATAVFWRRSKALFFLGGAFFLLLSPHSSVVPVAPQPMAESRMYLPLAVIVAFVVLGMYSVAGRRSFPLILATAVGLGFLTAHRNDDYRSALSIWSDTVAKDPDSSRAQNNLGIVLAGIPGRLPEAIDHYQRALDLNPGYAETHNNLGNALVQVPGRLPEAIAHYGQALRLKPDYPEVRANLANALAQLPNRLPDAIVGLEEAVRLSPDDPKTHNNLAIALAQDPGGLDKAIAQFKEALQLDPNYAEAHYNLAIMLTKIPGRLPEAIDHYERALRLKPDDAEIHNNLAIAYAKSGRIEEAIRHLEMALKLNPDFSDARDNLEKLKTLGASN